MAGDQARRHFFFKSSLHLRDSSIGTNNTAYVPIVVGNPMSLLSPRCFYKGRREDDTMIGKTKWTEKKIAEFVAAGRGSGIGKNYVPWLNRLTFSSKGRCRSTGISPKTGRVHEFFSDIEYHFFLCLERDKAVIDIREQFPLDRKIAQEVARQLNIRYPTYLRTGVPVVMTVDFLVTKIVDEQEQLVGYDTKAESAVENARNLAKLEIHRETLALMGIKHHIVLDSAIPRDLVNKLEWIRRPNIESAEITPYESYWHETESLVLKTIRKAAPSATLSEFCEQLDLSMGFDPGTAITAARQLMFKRLLEPDLRRGAIQDSAISTFSIPSMSMNRPAPEESRNAVSKRPIHT
jgi:hypothetical protein